MMVPDWIRKQASHVWIFTVLVALSLFFHLFGFGGHIGLSYKAGQYGNQWVPFWGAALALVIDLQACYMLRHLWQKKVVLKKVLWTIYCIWMLIMALMIIIGDAIVARYGEITGHNGVLAIWGSTWILMLLIMLNIVWFEYLQHLWEKKVGDEKDLHLSADGEKLPPIINASNNVATDTVPPRNSSNCCRRCCSLGCTIRGIGWSSIGFLSFFAFLLALQSVWSANDVGTYGPLGQRVTVRMDKSMNLSSLASVTSSSTINLHMLCKGPYNRGSTFLFEAGGGSFSASFFALQDRLTSAGRRSCLYDRAGYGWSDVLPVPTNSYQSMFHLHQLLQTAREAGPFILIGHSVGGQLIQLYATLFPSEVSGLILLDSVPDFIYPLSLTGKPLDAIVTFADIQPYLTSTKSIIDLYRVATAFGIHRWLQQAGGDYQPTSLANYYNAGYGKPLNWHAQYVDYTGTPSMIEILDLLSSQKYLNGFGWPTLRNSTTPVLGIITNTTAGGPSPLCSSTTDPTCTSASRTGRAYYDAMKLQVTTISTNSTFLVCDAPCSHGFVSTDKVDWIAQMIMNRFSSV